MTPDAQEARRQEFLSALTGATRDVQASPAPTEAHAQEAPAPTEPIQAPAPPAPIDPELASSLVDVAGAIEALAAAAQPDKTLSFEKEPPPASEVPPALAALATSEPAPPPAADPTAPLMNLGFDAQMQGTALGLRSIAQRLSIVAEGLKLIPILQGVARDLDKLNYPEVAAAVDALTKWAQDEERAFMQQLEERTAARQAAQD